MRCYRCQSDKTPEEFPKGNNRCRPCHKEYQAERKAKIAATFVLDRTGNKVCSTCKESKPKTEYGVAKTIKDGLQPQCNTCRRASRKNYNTSIKGHIQNMIDGAKHRNNQHQKGFAIDVATVAALWEKQAGICCLSGVAFVIENNTGYHKQSRHPLCPSIDRVDCTKGYTEDNIRLVTTIANLAVGTWGPEVLKDFALSLVDLHGYSVTPPLASTPPLQLQSPCTLLETTQ